MDKGETSAYLARIGAPRPVRPTAESLHQLHLRHLRTVPFENLSIHLDEPIVLEEKSLFEKLVERHRGGFCYELNGAFAALLEGLGFEVTRFAARSLGSSGMGPPYDHLALRVDLTEPWLVDVGFGKHSHYPLRLDLRSEQADPGGSFRIAEADHGDLDVILDGVPQYRLEPIARELCDFEATCWWHQTSPKSHFTQGVVCTMLTETGRVTLSDRRLIETVGPERRERTRLSDAEVLDAYKTYFGIEVDRVPGA
jgi:N-hydroxyarylamine O-acetyltransferase